MSDIVPVISSFEDTPDWFSILHRWKYGGERALADWVARQMVRRSGWVGTGIAAGPVLVPVPDDPGRLARRGFSPVGDLANRLVEWMPGPSAPVVDARLVLRRGTNRSQTECSTDAERGLNVESRFRTGELARWPRDRTLVLVDDQITSGATVRALVRLLRARGNPVKVWCAARAARAPTDVG